MDDVKILIGDLVLQIANQNKQIQELKLKIEEYERDLRASDNPSV